MKSVAIRLAALNVVLALACTGSQAQRAASKPDLHAGGPKPSLLPNHTTTTVTLPGFNLTGTTLTATGSVCTLKSYKIVSDSQIQMAIETHRKIDDKEDGCFLQVHQGAFETGTYVVVDLTQAEWDEKNAKQQADSKAKGEAYMAGLGKQWIVRLSDGSSETFTVQPAQPGELPDFAGSSGHTAKIMTTNGKAVIVVGSCMRTGTLVNGQVKDGTSVGECKPGGSWTGQMK
jgi:hypothetical protein